MAKKGKTKLSKVKRNNQTTNKMKKQGKLRLQRHKTKHQKQKQPTQPQVEYSSNSDSASGDEWADMLDEEEQQYIINRLEKEPGLLSNIPENDMGNTKKTKKRKNNMTIKNVKITPGCDSGVESEDESNSDLEENYEKKLAERPSKRFRPLLPIKTREGLQERAEEYEDSDGENQTDEQKGLEEFEPQSEQDSDSVSEGSVEACKGTEGNVVSTVQLLAARRDKLRNDKLRIGALCSSLLESPEKKLKNLYPILYLIEEQLKDGALNLISVRKLATVSAFEVFRDILPDYQIRHQDYSNVKLKKDTLAQYKYEKELLEFYKRYLQRLEKSASVMRQKKGDSRKIDESALSLGLVSFRCMCGMLEARPQFNYAINIAQSVVPFLDCREPRARELATQCCVTVFAEDNKGEITLAIVRLINQLVKRRGERLQPAALDCLLSLKIRDVELDAEADLKFKKKQEEKHKKRIVNLSKKEKKRAKKLKEVERELLETEAQESEMSRRKQLTEVTKTVFHIYFRLLKTAPRSKLLAAVLEGLAKFTHVINLEYYTDLVSILGALLVDEALGVRERLLCVRTVLAILAGTGDALNVDPAKFHAHLYSSALHVHAGSPEENARIVIEAIAKMCARGRRVSGGVLQAFGKRLGVLAAQLPPHAALAALVLLHQLTQQSKAVASLLETEESSGSGRFDPLLESPELCGAGAAALHELCALRRHHHPAARAVAAALLARTALPAEIAKLSPMQVMDQYDGSQMAFKPAIPPPKRGPGKPDNKYSNAPHSWSQKSLKEYCEAKESSVDLSHIVCII